MSKVKIIECPRDAMQGLNDFIPTDKKAAYINQLLKCGFDTIDFGSFVSPKAIPQLRDTAAVLSLLECNSETKLLAIIGNERGAEEAALFKEINYLGYPFSVSEEFQKRNTNATIEESLSKLEGIQSICKKSNKELVVYLSMGFGNPYGETWNAEIVQKWCAVLYNSFDVRIQAISDTIGKASVLDVSYLFSSLIPALPNVEFGAHLHTKPENAKDLIEAAHKSGCRRFDGAIKGFGGCPMATDALIGNLPTEKLLEWLEANSIPTGIDPEHFEKAYFHSGEIFPN